VGATTKVGVYFQKKIIANKKEEKYLVCKWYKQVVR
jgi:hypothetical protein